MKKVISILGALLLVLAFTVPVAAADVDTSVTILSGGTIGNPPDIAVAWVMPDDDPSTPGTQIYPPLVWGAYKDVWYFALVDDRQGDDDVVNVDVDVWHPAGSPPPYDANNYFKYERTMIRYKLTSVSPLPYGGVCEEHFAKYYFDAAVAAGVITPESLGINPNTGNKYTVSEIRYLIDQESIGFYAVKVWIHYEQPAGTYPVRIRAVDEVNNMTDLNFSFYYIPVSMVDFDFNAINFGSVMVNSTQEIDGDFEFAEQDGVAGYSGEILYPSPAQATVRNIGNVWSKITVCETNLFQDGTPLPCDPTWNVIYDACLSDPGIDNPKSVFYPNEVATLARPIYLSETQKLDFSIKFMKYGQVGSWTGDMTLGSVCYNFPWIE